MKNERYWAERFRQLEASQHDASERLAEEIQRQMRRAEAEIGKKIDAWYGRLMANNGVSMAEARRLLNGKELEEFRWDVDDYIRYGQENAYNQQWMKQLENASARAHISRLEQLRLQVQQEAEKLYGNYLDSVDRHMKSLYEEGFYKTAYEIQKGIGVGWNLSGIDSDRLEKIIRKPWAADRKNFSERIWSSKRQLIENVHTSLTQMCILGQSPDRAIDSLAKAMRTSRNQAGGLIMTESAFFGSEARKDSFRELGVEQYEIVATLDSSTSEICREMDGKVFPMSEYESGSTAPPFHVWCRTTTVPAFGDEFDKIGERAARNQETGKTYYVSADMTYREWNESFVDGSDELGLVQIPQINDERIRKANEEFSQILNSSESTPFSDKMILYNGATEYQLNERLGAPFAYDSKRDVIQYNPSAQNFEFYDMNFVQAHELSHRMDMLEYHSWKNEKFLQVIENTRQKVYDNSDKIAEWFSTNGKYEGDMALADIFSALSGGGLNEVLGGGHGVEYWQEDSTHACLEIFANMGAIDVMDYKSKEEFNGILKELHEAYKELVK